MPPSATPRAASIATMRARFAGSLVVNAIAPFCVVRSTRVPSPRKRGEGAPCKRTL